MLISRYFKINKIAVLLLLRTTTLIAILSMVVFVFVMSQREYVYRSDFLSYYTGAVIAKGGDVGSVYKYSVQNDYQKQILPKRLQHEPLLPFRLLPFVIILFYPLVHFGLGASYVIYSLFNILLFVTISKYLQKEIHGNSVKVVWCAVFLFFPAILAILIGQVSVLLVFVWFMIFRYLKNQKFERAGAAAAFLFLKPQYVILAPFIYLTSKNRSLFLKGFFSTLIVLAALCVLLAGFGGLSDYPKFLMETESIYHGSNVYKMVSLGSFFYNTGYFSRFLVYVLNGIFYLLFFVLFLRYYKKNSLENNFSVATLFTLPLAMHVWEHDLVLILLPIFFLLGYVLRKDSKNKKLAFVLLLCLYFCWILRFVFFPFLISFILLFVGVVLLVGSKMKLQVLQIKDHQVNV